MTVAFYLCICLLLIITQTIIFPMCPLFFHFFDLMLSLVIYMGFFRSIREGIPALIFVGLVMDSLSGAPFGLFFSSYLWLYIVVLFLKQIFVVKNLFLLSIVTALGVLMQNSMLIVIENLFSPKLYFLINAFNILWVEMAFALIGGPVMIAMIFTLHKNWNLRLRRTFSQGNEDYI